MCAREDVTISKKGTPLHLVHGDLGDPITPESRDGHRYVIVFVFDYSGTLGIYSLKSWSDPVRATKQSLADTVPNGTVNRLRSDNDGEYTRKEFKSLLYIPN